MAFHETFWVVTAAAAPVLGLAAVLSAGDLIELTGKVYKLVSYDEQGRAHGVRAKRIDHLSSVIEWLAVAQSANILGQAALLSASLWAILSQVNEGPPLLWLAVAVFGLVILGAAGFARIWVRLSGLVNELPARQAAVSRPGYPPSSMVRD